MTTSLSPQSGIRRRLVPALAAVTVLVVVVGGGYALRQASNDAPSAGGAPTVLRLADYQPPTADGPADNTILLAGDLPDGPDDAAIRWLTAPDRTDVEALAKALGLRGHLTSGGGAATYATDSASLRVQLGPGGQWQYVRAAFTQGTVDCPPSPTPVPKVDDPALSVTCDVASPAPLSDNPTSTGPVTGGSATDSQGATKSLSVTTPEGARKAARPVLDTVGIDAEAAVVRAGRPMGVVAADPTVEGLPTHGLTTTVTVSGKRVTAAGGWLGGSRAGATYPVITARAAWKQLVHTPMPRPLVACPEPQPAGSDPTICGGPITVTGARFGLSVHEVDGRPLLVPSWLFDVRDSDSPLSVVAVDPRYLAAPSAPTAGGSKPGSSGSGSSGSGSSGSGSDGSTGTVVPPVAPSPGAESPNSPSAEAPPESRFSAVSVSASGTELNVTFTGGVHACFSYSVVPTESKQEVSLSLVERTSSNKRCVEMAQVYERRVALAQPLGARRVVDSRTGVVLLASPR